MLSICIPIYNQNVTKLVTDLKKQMDQVSFSTELILIDDDSESKYKILNEPVCSQYQYYKLEANVGRSKIRNLFLKYAKYDYLLFLDCDAQIISDNLLMIYYYYLSEKNYDVICGGSIYPEEKPDRNKYLRWKNGHQRETILPEKRMLSPYGSFMTSNVVIKKSVFCHTTFDESLVEYGHEDTLFGFALMKKKVPLLHIYNPVLNADLDVNKVFVEKIEKSLGNLVLIIERIDYDPDFITNNKLLSLFFKLKKIGIIPIFRLCFYLTQPLIKAYLISGLSNLRVFDIYKLGVLSVAFFKKK